MIRQYASADTWKNLRIRDINTDIIGNWLHYPGDICMHETPFLLAESPFYGSELQGFRIALYSY